MRRFQVRTKVTYLRGLMASSLKNIFISSEDYCHELYRFRFVVFVLLLSFAVIDVAFLYCCCSFN